MLTALNNFEILDAELNALLEYDSTKAFPSSLGSNINTFSKKLNDYTLTFKQEFALILPQVGFKYN